MKKFIASLIFSIFFSLFLIITSILFGTTETLGFSILFSTFIILLSILLKNLEEFKKRVETEENFRKFLKDFLTELKIQKSLKKTFRILSKRNYGNFSNYVKISYIQSSFGKPWEEIFENLSKKLTFSSYISNILKNLSYIIKVNGNLTRYLSSLNKLLILKKRYEDIKRKNLSFNLLLIYSSSIILFITLIFISKPLFPNIQNIDDFCIRCKGFECFVCQTMQLSKNLLPKDTFLSNFFFLFFISYSFWASILLAGIEENKKSFLKHFLFLSLISYSLLLIFSSILP